MKTLHATGKNKVGSRPAYYRTVWISDVHLGFSGCKAEFLLDFLHSTRCDQLYLVGDIIDVWCMKKRLYWPQEHNNVVRTLLGKAKHGTRVVTARASCMYPATTTRCSGITSVFPSATSRSRTVRSTPRPTAGVSW